MNNHVTILNGLQAANVSTAAAGPFNARGAAGAVHYELGPGAFVHIILSPGGVTVKNGEAMVLLPLNEITHLAIQHDPRVRPVAMTEIKAPLPPNSKIVPLTNK